MLPVFILWLLCIVFSNTFTYHAKRSQKNLAIERWCYERNTHVCILNKTQSMFSLHSCLLTYTSSCVHAFVYLSLVHFFLFLVLSFTCCCKQKGNFISISELGCVARVASGVLLNDESLVVSYMGEVALKYDGICISSGLIALTMSLSRCCLKG